MRFLITFLIIPYLAISQPANCKWALDEVDEFTKDHKKFTQWKSLYDLMGTGWYVQFRVIDQSIALDLKVSIDLFHNRTICISEGDQWMFKLSNDSIVTLRAIKTDCAIVSPVGSQGLFRHQLVNSFTVAPEQIDLFFTHPVSKVRLNTSDGHFDQDIKPAGMRRFTELAWCVRDAIKSD